MIYPWQQTQWHQTRQLLQSERLPHALLLHGNEGLGKTDFARSLASTLLCRQPAEDQRACGSCSTCDLLAAGTHPDLHYLKPTAAENSKSKNPVMNIRIDAIRRLCDKLNQTSQFSGYRVAILEQADKLTSSAANSLLKTLEEPGEKVVMILVTAKTYRLPVTIRSRCQSMRFSVPGEQTSLQWLKQYLSGSGPSSDHDDRQLQQALKLAFGSPLSALLHLQDMEYQQIISEALTASISGNNSLDYAAKLVKFPKVKTLESLLSWTSDLSRLVACGADSMLINEQHRDMLQSLAQKVNQQRLYRFQDQLNFNILHSTIAVNEQLLWENLLLSWDNL
ncbi:MAG TPA: DNA polymerase III subunit delta' [Gammaproteobacteria bacterium]|nr:DNA polymerase III subunit delta' [Gammaproteobacteria bacterium]